MWCGWKGLSGSSSTSKGTNYPLTSKHARVHNNIADSEDALLAATNKWLIGHEEGGLDDTAFIGLKGVNPDING